MGFFNRLISKLMGDCPNCKTQDHWEFEFGKKYKCTECGETARLTDETGYK